MKKSFIVAALLLMVPPVLMAPRAYGATLGTSAATPDPSSSFSATTGLFSPASGVVSVTSAGSEKMRVNTTGVGIGTTSPANLLYIYSSALSGVSENITQPTTATGNYYSSYDMTNSNGLSGRIATTASNYSSALSLAQMIYFFRKSSQTGI
jgi:hypothetical protein